MGVNSRNFSPSLISDTIKTKVQKFRIFTVSPAQPESLSLTYFSLALLLSVAVNTFDARAEIHYQVNVDNKLSELSVQACFGDYVPSVLVAESLDATVALIDVRTESGEAIKPSGVISMRDVAPGSCLSYRVDISRGVQRHDMTGPKVYKSGGATGVSNGLWLWRPEILPQSEQFTVEFSLPTGIAVATPWEQLHEAAYKIQPTPYEWPSWIVLGKFFDETLNIGDTKIRLAILDGTPKVNSIELFKWLENETNMVQSVLGTFPHPNVQILVFPNARAREPVPVAYVTRGGSPTLHMMINQRRPIENFYSDWTATHELAHLYFPFISPDDAWLYEGFASYYQYVVRARSGLLTPEEAWTNLLYGFRRGEREASARDESLSDAITGMYRSGPFMRVYWTGAAILLMADVELRHATNGSWSLDRVVQAYNECCMNGLQPSSAEKLLAKFDELVGSPIFTPLMQRFINSKQFPDLSQVLRDLGVTTDGHSVVLRVDASKRKIRDEIMLGDNQQSASVTKYEK